MQFHSSRCRLQISQPICIYQRTSRLTSNAFFFVRANRKTTRFASSLVNSVPESGLSSHQSSMAALESNAVNGMSH